MNGGAANQTCGSASSASSIVSTVVSSLPPMAATKMSAWRQSTPFGAPVVPPVHTR